MMHCASISTIIFLLVVQTVHSQRFFNFLTSFTKNGFSYGDDWRKTRVSLPPNLSTGELIVRRGYPMEVHDIKTDDGYILTVYRIPHGKGDRKFRGGKPPVYILHGSAQSSADWLINSDEDNCLPFILANAGFDVWLGSIRGTVYSSRHVTLSDEQSIFWDFSLDELAQYDLPNTIDYILWKSGESKLHYIGFSLGNTLFYMTMSDKPDYNDKIGLHVSYSPVVYFKTFPKITSFLALFTQPLNALQKLIGGFPVPPQGITFLLNQLLSLICSQRLFEGVCTEIMFLFGFGPKDSHKSATGTILGHLLTPTSLKMFIQILQMVQKDRFCHYDEGPLENEELYRQIEPPDYPLNQVTAPVAIFFGRGDKYANEKGVVRLARNLPNLIDFYTVPKDDFTHLDFIYGTHANHLVYNHTLHLLHKYS